LKRFFAAQTRGCWMPAFAGMTDINKKAARFAGGFRAIG